MKGKVVMPQRAHPKHSGQTLVAMLVVIVIIMLLYLAFFRGGNPLSLTGSGQNQKSLPGQAMDKGKQVVCIENLRQIRAAIQMRVTTEENRPANLAELKLPAEMLKCAVGGEPYVYHPQTGVVQCPHPGHQRL
jgi:hypothetical protein